MARKMTERQKRFADNYIETGNVFQSALYAGYSEKYAKGNASRLLENVSVKAHIDKRLKELDDKSIVSQKEALQLLSQLARGEVKDAIPLLVGEGVQELANIPTPSATRYKAIENLLKRHDVADKDKLQLRRTELEIQKLEKELQSTESTEDKMSEFLDKMDKLVENDDN